MATELEYAQWIVDNKDKRGTPEFEKIAKAHQLSKTKQSQDFEFSPLETISNVPSSLYNYGKDIASAVLSPIDTAKGALDIGAGTLRKALPNKFVDYVERTLGGAEAGQMAQQKAEAVGDYYKNKYFSGNALESFQKDPIGVAGDVSGVLTGGASILPKVGRVGSVASNVSKAGAAIEPLNLALNAAKYGAAKALPTTAPRKLYESAAKWSTTLSDKEKAALTETALAEQILPTYEGVGVATQKIKDLGGRIDELITEYDSAGVEIPAETVLSYIDDVKKDLGGFKVEGVEDVAKIEKLEKKFKSIIKRKKNKTVTARELQDWKTDAYDKVNWDAKRQKGSMAKEKVYKAVARAAKDALVEASPEIAAVNKRQASLLNLLPNLERAAGRIENRDIIGIGGGIKTQAGAAMGGVPGAVVGAGQSYFDLPKVKSKAALGLYNAQNRGARIFLDNDPRNALLRQLLEEQGAYDQSGVFSGAGLL